MPAMTARQIASHRYGEQGIPFADAKNELAADYRRLLTTHDENQGKLTHFVKLVPPLLECRAAHLLFILGKEIQELSQFDARGSTKPLGPLFRRQIASDGVRIVKDVAQECKGMEKDCMLEMCEVKAYMSAGVKVSGLDLCLLVATDDKPRPWTKEDVQRVQDVAQMLITNLEATRERQLISVQRRMQRSLVQFVRGNLNSQEDGAEGNAMQHRTGSLYSDLDEDLEADDADDETEPYETSRMNVMFDFSARLIRRTLKISGCVLVNIENITQLTNIEADIPLRSTIMGACFLKHLRHREWHENRSNEGSSGVKTRSSVSADSDDLQTKNVARQDVFDARGLSGSWLKQLLETHPRAVAFDEHDLPEALTTLLPIDVKSCLLSPIYDSNAKAFALIIAFDDKAAEFSKADAHYIEAFGSSIYAEVLNQSLQKANEAKALFISKISHEFRTPLHGILASAEFLNDMAETTPSQIGFVQTIDTCGRTLLDIINHVLDYSKLSFSKNVLAEDAIASNITQLEDFDLVEVSEQVLTTAFSSYEFKRINEHVDVQKTNSQQSHQSDSDSGHIWEALGRNLEVIVLAPARPQGYLIHSDLGAFRRIVLNLLGNALKYTHIGHVIIELNLKDNGPNNVADLTITITDTGIGITSSFLAEMFRPFTQEDEFSAGTGLGLSIVKELCNKLHGTIEVQSRKRKGSRFRVSYPVIPAAAKPTLFPGAGFRRDLEKVKFHYLTSEEIATEEADSVAENAATSLLRKSIVHQLVDWYGMQETAIEMAELLLTDDLVTSRSSDVFTNFAGPVLTLCSTTAKYEKNMRRRSRPLQMFMTKPCGPNKLGAWVTDCLNKARNLSRMDDSPVPSSVLETSADIINSPRPSSIRRSSHSTPPSLSSTVRPNYKSNITGGGRRTIKEEQDEQNLADMYSMQSISPRSHRSTSQSSPALKETEEAEYHWDRAESTKQTRSSNKANVVFDPATSRKTSIEEVLHRNPDSSSPDEGLQKKHILIVEDNPVNMMLLVAFAKRQHLTVTTAINGAIAVDRVKERLQNFDAVLMDINMPVMNGFQAVKAIRKYEKIERPVGAKIVALTGLSTAEDQARATAAGCDAFFTKPVKFANLRQLLVTWDVLPAETDTSEKD